MSDSILLGSLHNYRLWFAQLEARERGDTMGEAPTEKLSLWGHTGAGVLAGWTVCTFITPIEHIKAKLQMQTVGPKLYAGPIDCAKQVYNAGGIPGLWRGFGATLAFRSWMGVMYGSYELILRTNRAIPEDSPYRLSEPTAIFVAGGLGANAFWLCSFPFDAVKNRLMADSPTNPRYPTWKSAALQIWKEGGVKVSGDAAPRGVVRSCHKLTRSNISYRLCTAALYPVSCARSRP